MDTVTPINVLIVDDHAMFRQGLARVLEKEPGIHLIGQCATTAEALAFVDHKDTTVVLLDVDLGPERAIDFVNAAKEKGYTGHILVVTAGVSAPEAVQLIQSGISGILHKHHSMEALCKTIRQVAAGEVYLEKEYMTALFRSASKPKDHDRSQLTERDKTVLRFVFQGLSNREIGTRLQISESAVKSSLRQLFGKLGVRTRSQLVKVALEQYRDQL